MSINISTFYLFLTPQALFIIGILIFISYYLTTKNQNKLETVSNISNVISLPSHEQSLKLILSRRSIFPKGEFFKEPHYKQLSLLLQNIEIDKEFAEGCLSTN